MRVLLLLMLLVFGLFLAGGLLLPNQVSVERSIAIQRPPATVFTVVNQFDRYSEWLPWADLDPDAQFLVTGPEQGAGARVSWTGDPTLLGSGWIEIVESKPWEAVRMQLDLGTQGISDTQFTVVGDSLGSRLSWRYDTDVTAGQGMMGALMSRYFGLLLDGWIGDDFEQGLSDLKRLIESFPEGDFSSANIEKMELDSRDALLIRNLRTSAGQGIDGALAVAYDELTRFMAVAGLSDAGAPISVAREREDGSISFDAVIPVSRLPARTPGRIVTGLTPGGDVARITHLGPYDSIGASYQQLSAWVAANGLPRGNLSWEVYLDDPGKVLPEQLRTEIYFLLQSSN